MYPVSADGHAPRQLPHTARHSPRGKCRFPYRHIQTRYTALQTHTDTLHRPNTRPITPPYPHIQTRYTALHTHADTLVGAPLLGIT